ncbi:UDP-2,3-diacylglucosamine diphosphatase [Marinibactrum halimedae]|uniref:UDP-2,3-diacylglucosamine hydrolase n=1 Tax=Marinibactrum halimedae TaxID=1444977 RepID=A0AA37WLN1_9GAMM|nr:UDP-2,3-diacylglucosamine diphosphatase [Marinibactrum halimedae]MCD9461183.1 UDP-2,3-diacylglucosamine diphosphatase [Marinibactrum halimedae]GLS26194.1 UDP-2,3-diacylglucosamine hydrolase [Marinibactrum halimedae]
MAILFISDLHLDKNRPHVTRAFFRFLTNEASNADALYILGDFFEMWIGDDDDDEFVAQVIDALKRFTQSGIPTYFMRGNRDFLIGDEFAEKSGVHLLPDPTVVTLYDEPVLLMHGDSLCTKDEQYMAFRQQARSHAWQAEVLSKPLEERRAIAAHLRQQSKVMSSRKSEDIMDVTPEEVIKHMAHENTLKFIHGHTHRPARHDITVEGKNAERIVLGDWEDNAWYLKVEPDEWSLIEYSIR